MNQKIETFMRYEKGEIKQLKNQNNNYFSPT